jgi:hypothetical protein
MTSADVVEKIQFAVKTGLVNPEDAMFDPKYDRFWSELIGDDWQDKVLIAIYELSEKQITFNNMFGPIHPN